MIQTPGSAAGRFLRKALLALGWAAVFGTLFAILLYFRLPRAAPGLADPTPPLHVKLRAWVESLELATFDWRAKALGRVTEPGQEVVVVALDEGTLTEAARDRDPEVAMRPWPRRLVGELVGEMVEQGARLVLLDLPFSSLSPRTHGPGGPDDDLAFRALLDRVPKKSVLAFSAHPQAQRHVSLERSLHELTLVDQAEDRAGAAALVREVLTARRPAYAIPDGARQQVWAAVASEEDARALLDGLDRAAQEPVVRPRTNVETAYEVDGADLLVWLSEIEVEGLNPASLLEVKGLEYPAAPLLGDRSLYGNVSLRPDPDGVVRSVPLVVRLTGRDGRVHLLPSMPLAAAMELAGTRALSYRDGRLHVGDAFHLPMSRTGEALILWERPDAYDAAGTLDQSISAWNVLMRLRERQEGHPRPRTMSALDGRVAVFTDVTARSGEHVRTPVGPDLPRGAVLGQALANLLQSRGVERLPPRWDALAALAMAFLGAFLALTFSGALRSAVGAALYVLLLIAAASVYAWAARYLFVERQQWIALAGPLLAFGSTFGLATLHGIRTEREVRDFIFSVLGRSVSPEVARQVAKDFDLIRPERREVTVYFSDLEGFTRLSERADPEKLVGLLEEYFEEMSRLLRATGGHLDKFVGDGLMALWNAPNPNPRHAEKACESALRMRDAVARRQGEWEKRYGYRVVVRAGINSGDAVVGHMGANVRASYTAIGEAVNFGARLEHECQAWGTHVLVGQETWERAKEAFVFREVDVLRIPGAGRTERAYELLGRKGEDPALAEQVAAFDAALALYRERRFDEASDAFTLIATERNDAVAAAYVARCRQLKASPPPLDWDGAWPAEL